MVRAIVGANWGRRGQGKDNGHACQRGLILSSVFREAAMQGTPLSMITENLPFIFCPPVYFTSTPTSIIGNGVALNIPYLVL